MKKLLLLFLLLAVASAEAQLTPFFYYFRNADGTPNTNNAQMQAWPPSVSYTIVGTNIVYGGQIITLTNDGTGFGTNQVYANTYSVLFTNMVPNQGFFVNIPVTSVRTNLALYLTNTLVINASNLNAWGGVRGLITDTSLEFITQAVQVAGTLIVYTNTAGGVTSITLSNSVPNATNLLGKISPTNITYGSFYTNALTTNLAATQLWTNGSGSNITGRVSWLGTVTTALSNNFTFFVISTNEVGAMSNNFTTVSTNTGYITNREFTVTVNNGSILTFGTQCSTNATYDLRVSFTPWLLQ